METPKLTTEAAVSDREVVDFEDHPLLRLVRTFDYTKSIEAKDSIKRLSMGAFKGQATPGLSFSSPPGLVEITRNSKETSLSGLN